MSRLARAAALAAAALLAAAAPAAANVPLTQVSSDPFTNASSQHATEVEPDTFANGSTVVTAMQVGRFYNGGATDIGFARSGDGGTTWTSGVMPGMTFNAGAASSYERVSDASVAYDAAHRTWMVSSIPLLPDTSVPTVLFNRSTDDGLTWSAPVSMPPPVAHTVDLDKNWTVCDNTASRFRGHCYTELDNYGDGDRELMTTSTDGGETWSTPIETAGHDKGIGGQPLVQPDGTVVVPFESLDGKIAAFRSTDGGASWSKALTVSGVRDHAVAGSLRTSPLPTAEIDGAGRVFVAWQDCRFRLKCSANDIVFSSSADGVSWSEVSRVPIDSVTSGRDHFIPGLAVDRATSGANAHLALTYYFYPDTTCTGGCRLEVGSITSPDGGAHWGDATQLAGPMALSQIALTSQGPMTGDYISTSFTGGRATSAFPVGRQQPTASTFDEATYAPARPIAVATKAEATHASSSAGAASITGQGTGEAHHAVRDD